MVNYLLLRRMTGEVNQSYEDYQRALELDYEEMAKHERQIVYERLCEVTAYKEMMELYWSYLENKER